MRNVAIAGVALTKFGKSNKSNIDLFVDVSLKAIKKSRIDPSDVQGLFFGNCFGDFSEGQSNMASFVHSSIGLKTSTPSVRFELACATATVAIRNAALLVGSGIYDIILAGGVETVSNIPTSIASKIFSMATHSKYEAPSGLTLPGVFGMAAHAYSNKYGIKLNDLKKHMAGVSVKNHYHGSKNKNAHFQNKISIKDVLSGIVISDPLQILDCCPFSDGAAAVIIMSANTAKKLVKKPIFIAGMGQASNGHLCTQKDFTRVISREISSRIAYSEAGVVPKEVDICEIHDCFSIAEIIAIEGLGLYDFGSAYKSSTNKETYFTGGKTAVNTSGGLKARGHPVGATGAAQVVEIVEQLRGESGDRQVNGAKIGIVDTMGGGFGTVCNIILRNKL